VGKSCGWRIRKNQKVLIPNAGEVTARCGKRQVEQPAFSGKAGGLCILGHSFEKLFLAKKQGNETHTTYPDLAQDLKNTRL
jgi:hypothetical protein